MKIFFFSRKTFTEINALEVLNPSEVVIKTP